MLDLLDAHIHVTAYSLQGNTNTNRRFSTTKNGKLFQHCSLDSRSIPFATHQMALFLGLLGGAAAVEIHRAVTKNFDESREKHPSQNDTVSALKADRVSMVALIEALKRKEAGLSANIKAVEEELEGSEKKSKAEISRLNRVCSQLKEQLEVAETQHRQVAAAYNDVKNELKAEATAHEELKALHGSLLEENEMLISQFERLKTKHDEETAVLQRQIAALQDNVSSILTEYVYATDVAIDDLVQRLGEIGVQMAEKDRLRLQEGLKAKRGKERAKVIQGLEVVVDEEGLGFMDMVRCAGSPTRAARLFFKGEKEGATLASSGREDAERGDEIKAVHAGGVQANVSSVRVKNTRNTKGKKIVVPVTRMLI
jgi:hypothetical protein